nr:NifB/NifX family molybdenum-iron cluster-binding protein [Desulfosporosinus acidiphilus]
MVAEHFGHCHSFSIFQVENNQIVQIDSILNPGHKPGFIPDFLDDLGVSVIVSGDISGGAIEIFNEKGISVITGAKGHAKIAAEQYLQGSLKTNSAVCHEHIHQGECGN